MYFYWVSLFLIAAVNLYFILLIAKMIGIKYIIQAKKVFYLILLNNYVKKCLKLDEGKINKEVKLKNIIQNIRSKMTSGIMQMKGTIFNFFRNNIYQKDLVKKKGTINIYSSLVIFILYLRCFLFMF